MSEQTTNLAIPLPIALLTSKRYEDIVAVRQAIVKIDQIISGLETGSGSSSGETGGSFKATIPGVVQPFTGTLRYYPKAIITVSSITAWMSGLRASPVVIEICRNGTPIRTVTIPSGQEKVTTATNFVVNPTDYVSLNVLGGTAMDLVVRMDY